MANPKVCIECERRTFCHECKHHALVIPPEITTVNREEYQRLIGKPFKTPHHIALREVSI